MNGPQLRGDLSRVPSPNLEDLPAEVPGSGRTPASEAAGREIKKHARKLGERILELFDLAGSNGLTNAEVAALTGERDVTAWPRVTHLRNQGKIRPSAATRPSPKSGRAMTVWVRTTEAEERQILAEAERAAAPYVRTATAEAAQAAEQLVTEWTLGELFRSQGHVQSVIQAAIDAALGKAARAARKAALDRLAAQDREGD